MPRTRTGVATDGVDATLTPVVDWYLTNRRDLPWRQEGTSPWAVLVSEVMLQQTPVARVEPVWRAWLERWPRPGDLADESPAEVIRAWGRLGYPRRALRLHEAATVIRDEHGGQVPADPATLRGLPGIGDYTAAAVSAFAHGQRVAVLDTNVRRVHHRWLDGVALPRTGSPTRAEYRRAERLLPLSPQESVLAGVAVMELGALVCTARATPACHACPLADSCRWLADGRPDGDVRRPAARFEGSLRQARGRILAVLRESADPVPTVDLVGLGSDRDQMLRALTSLGEDGLVIRDGAGHSLPR